MTECKEDSEEELDSNIFGIDYLGSNIFGIDEEELGSNIFSIAENDGITLEDLNKLHKLVTRYLMINHNNRFLSVLFNAGFKKYNDSIRLQLVKKQITNKYKKEKIQPLSKK